MNKEKVTLLDNYYESDSLEGGKDLEEFFKNLTENIFEVNREIYGRSKFYPLLYSEEKCYSAMSCAIHQMGLGHMSEF